MAREYRIWDNGKKCTIINEYECYDCDNFESLVGDDPIGFLNCNCSSRNDYGIKWNCGEMKTTADVFNWVMTSKPILNFNFKVSNIIATYGSDTYIGDGGEEVKISEDITSTEELRDLVYNMFQNECFDDAMLFSIIARTDFKDFIIKPFYMYDHSGISVSLSSFMDPWDSGVAGFAWVEPYDGKEHLENNAEQMLKDDFEIYDKYINGYYKEYSFRTYYKEEGIWTLEDEYYDFLESFEDAWSNFDLGKVEDYTEEFTEEDKENVRKRMIISNDDILDYMENLC